MTILMCEIAVVLAIAFATYNFQTIKQMEEGNEEMAEIASAIRVGATAFMVHEYKILFAIASILAVLLCAFISTSSGIAFVIGVTMSAAAGWIGMKIATYTNVRVANEARITKTISSTVRVALKGSSVMGLCVAAFSLLGLIIVYGIFGNQLDTLENVKNWAGFTFVPFIMTLSSYALGCSVVAIFARVGGGIYTKAADMGADLVGKTEEDIPEDDPRNPATIADNVGDNVGDIGGTGSDLLESNVGGIVSAMLIGIYIVINGAVASGEVSIEIIRTMCMYPLGVASLGLIACVISLILVLSKEMSKNPYKDLNRATFISATLTAVLTAVYTNYMFASIDCATLGFKYGVMSPWISASIGVISGILIGRISEYYTSYDYEPTRQIAFASREGAGINITEGISVGMKSCLITFVLLAIAFMTAEMCAGIYGVAISAVGMLSFVATTVSVDAYGPISDNAGGIAEMAHLHPQVREITDKLDSVGNTTAAMGKGFAIGSAAFAALSLMVCYMYSYKPFGEAISINVLNPMVIVGLLLGTALPFYFSGMLIKSVSVAAGGMVDEVRRQFREIAGLREGKVKPDYKRCIEISSSAALREMKAPALLAVLVPVGSGFLFGPDFVAGLLIGAIVSAIALAIFSSNTGGAWDNAKKFIEAGGVEGEWKGSLAHHAAVVGDTVGDPFKDTSGPSLNILVKIMSTISLIMVCMFAQMHLFG